VAETALLDGVGLTVTLLGLGLAGGLLTTGVLLLGAGLALLLTGTGGLLLGAALLGGGLLGSDEGLDWDDAVGVVLASVSVMLTTASKAASAAMTSARWAVNQAIQVCPVGGGAADGVDTMVSFRGEKGTPSCHAPRSTSRSFAPPSGRRHSAL
jgi:hypothetical protein